MYFLMLSGIGYWTALDLAKRNARVILACRNVDKGRKAVDSIIETTGNKNVMCRKMDLSSMASVREFATQFLKTEKQLNILINNAGVAGIAWEH